ncbi:hypothetical protein KAI11_04770, partial [Candidatus Bathyarchaeota archaeon]|nr:hypothetical protein [Candidatus Bathyarchaeota archaeon]
MRDTEYLLGIDIGTTSTKVALFDLMGTTIASMTREYQLITPSSLEVELNIETFWESFKDGVKGVLSKSNIKPGQIKALGISAQGETLVPIDKKEKPLRRSIIWLDNRAQEEAEILNKKFNDNTSYHITGQIKLIPTWPASKILWIRRHEPDIFNQVYKYLLVEDYFIW